MNDLSNNLNRALDDVSASSMGGAPFLIVYSATFFTVGILSVFVPRPTAALLAMFQGVVALPLAFWLERKLSTRRMAPNNPLRELSVLLAVSQALGLPLLIVLYSLNPGGVPLALASFGGIHFLSYAWLQRTRVYIYMAVALSLGSFAIQLWLGSAAFTIVLLYTAALYGTAAPFIYQSAASHLRAAKSKRPEPKIETVRGTAS